MPGKMVASDTEQLVGEVLASARAGDALLMVAVVLGVGEVPAGVAPQNP